MDYRIYDQDDETTESESSYRNDTRRKRKWMIVIFLSLIVITLLSLYIGNPDYSVADITKAIFTMDRSSVIGKFIWNIDLPIAVAAMVAGAALSLAGAAMQCILRNPLASPYTLGISNAAAFGAAASILFLTGSMTFGTVSNYITPISAFVMAIFATGLILFLTKVTKTSSETMILAGIAVSAIFSAGMTLMQYMADSVQLSQIVSWTFGSVSYTTWNWNIILIAATAVAAVYFYSVRWDMNAMNAGDEVAKGLGVNTDRFLVIGLTVAAVITAFVVSQFGVISFVGLLGPHIARTMVGEDHKALIPMSILTGALLLLVANVIARNIILPAVLPVGLLTSLIGGPAFIFMLIRRYRTS